MKKFSNKKIFIILGIIITVLIITIGVTYAMYSLTKTGQNSTLIAGDIYMKYGETTALTLNGAMPSTTYDNTKYFQFDITGKNTSNTPIWYEIVLTDGDKPNNRNTKLNDKFLKFTLYKGNTMVVNGASYEDITNQRLYTDSVNANTNSETTTTYKLYMWIDNSVVIGNVNQDYTTTQWNDIYAAVKVNVNARTETDASCFTLSNKDDTNHTAKISAYDVSCGGTDIIIPRVIDGYTIIEYTTPSFNSKGLTNVIMQGGITTIGTAAFLGNQLTSIEIPDSVTTIGMSAFENNLLTSVVIGNGVQTIGQSAFIGNCVGNKNCITNLKLGNNVQTIGTAAFIGNQLTSIEIPDSVTTIERAAFQNNQLTSVEIPDSVTTIGAAAFYGNQLTDVIINGNNLTLEINSAFLSNPIETLKIGLEGTVNIAGPNDNGDGVFSGLSTLRTVIIGPGVSSIGRSAFMGCGIETLKIGNNVTTIGYGAFYYNQLTSLEIPDSVTTIGPYSFCGNRLTSVSLGNHVTTIGDGAFYGATATNNGTTYGPNQIASVTIPTSVNSMPCNAFANQGGGITTQITYENPNFTCTN